jgi:uncharacterized glyoxalase superfamily protein PhnB
MNKVANTPEPAIAACSHLVVTSKNVSLMTKFMESYFGIKAHYANRQFADFVLLNGFRIAFFAAIGKTVEYFSANGERHFMSIGVTTKNLDDLFAKTQLQEFTEMGVRVSGPPKEHPWGERSFLLIDPDGNRWEITESPSDSGMLVNRDFKK